MTKRPVTGILTTIIIMVIQASVLLPFIVLSHFMTEASACKLTSAGPSPVLKQAISMVL